MLVVVPDVKSKRQKTPRCDVGEMSAAFTGREEVYLNPTCEFSSQLFEFTSSDSTETQKWDERAPNLNETCASKPRLVFGGALAREVRVTKRGRSVRCSGIVGSSWHSGITPGIRNGNWKLYGDDGGEEAMSNIRAELCAADGSQECFDPETCNMSKGSRHYCFDDSVPRKTRKELSADEGFCTAVEGGTVRPSFSGAVVNNIRGWLDDLGFSKYADVFEMHEVDGEVLPLLTFADLKEMGINAVGCRRKMFNAIQLLKD